MIFVDNQTKLPFIEISIISTTEKEISMKEILNIIKKRNHNSNSNKSSWKGTSSDLILRLDYESREIFEKSYQQGFDLLKLFMNKLQTNQITKESLFPQAIIDSHNKGKQIIESGDSTPYLILKYRANFKEPMRKNYDFGRWYADFFQENVFIEEIEDGFLHFFLEKDDFLDSNLNKMNPQEFQKWVKNKGIHFPEELLKEFFKILAEKKEK